MGPLLNEVAKINRPQAGGSKLDADGAEERGGSVGRGETRDKRNRQAIVTDSVALGVGSLQLVPEKTMIGLG